MLLIKSLKRHQPVDPSQIRFTRMAADDGTARYASDLSDSYAYVWFPIFFLGSCIMLRGGLGFSSTWAARWLFKCQYASSMEGPNNGMQPSCRRCQGRPRNSLGCGPDRKKLHLRNIYKIPQNKKCPPCREDVRLPWPKIPSNRVRIPRISAERRTHWKL